jgi:deoxycytidine triphosphate deaminase
MVIVGENLKALIEQHGLIDNPDAFDHASLTLRLNAKVELFKPPESANPLVYGDEVPKEWIEKKTIEGSGIRLDPGMSFLGCSEEFVKIPLGYIGFIQTKGSLARLFVQVQCSDGQIDPGFQGRITFEVCNLGPLTVRLKEKVEVAQLFLIATSTREVRPYSGRYQGKDGPTHYIKPR